MEVKNRETKKKNNKTFLKVIIILVAIIAICGGVIVGYISNKLSQINYKEDEKENFEVEVNEGVNSEGYMNIALFGVDSRENSYDNTRSDCIMIVSINEKTKKVKLASVYRDSYLKFPKKSFDKVTHAFAEGGPAYSISTLNTNLDLDISKYVAINFEVVLDAVDAVGGINMEITSEETKYINPYIDEIEEVCGKKADRITEAGTYNLNGVQALAYSRIRYTAGGDYKRTERMRDVLMKTFEKAKKMNLAELNNLADKILPEVSTNMSTIQIISLASKAAQYDIDESIGWPYEVRGYQPASVWYAAPVNLEENVKKLHKALFDEEDYEVSSTVKNISNELIKKTGYK